VPGGADRQVNVSQFHDPTGDDVMSTDRLQLQRFELKYIVPERITVELREFVRPYLALDEHGVGRPDFSYPIHSVYLDSDDLVLYWGTMQGMKNRYKLRVRFYEDTPGSPVFFEIKRRSNDAILKQRAAVHRQAVNELLRGRAPCMADLVAPSPRQMAALERFSSLMLLLRATPKAHVAYLREAWTSVADNSVRVTMDRDVRSEPEPGATISTRMRSPVPVFGRSAIVEIKFTGRFPTWLQEVVQVFDLERCSAAKYAEGVNQIGGHRMTPAMVEWSPPPARRIQAVAASGSPLFVEEPA
jgi:hypothetical protein